MQYYFLIFCVFNFFFVFNIFFFSGTFICFGVNFFALIFVLYIILIVDNHCVCA